jgi:hypothetical protein
MKQIRLSKYFFLSEFCESQIAARNGIIIEPEPHIIEALRELSKRVLDPLREELGPLMVTSGYRPRIVNTLVGGARGSQHVLGQAADIKSCKYPARQVFDTARRLNLPFDQCILEFGQWTHLSYRSNPRGQALVAEYTKEGTAYKEAL